MTWQKQIPGCFAGMTAPFAVHPNDKKRARAMMNTMQKQGVSWSEADEAIRDYLAAQNVTQDEMRKQMQGVEERLKPWLS